jgi:hypothetical protein
MPALAISPMPSPEEAAAITAAVTAVIAAACGGDTDPLPAAYRSMWRRAAIREGAGLPADQMRSR